MVELSKEMHNHLVKTNFSNRIAVEELQKGLSPTEMDNLEWKKEIFRRVSSKFLELYDVKVTILPSVDGTSVLSFVEDDEALIKLKLMSN